MTDMAVVGAGAAGLMTAIQAARANPKASILLLDSRVKIGAKILISGGTRCNVTNVRVSPSDFKGGPAHFIKHTLEAFNPDETMRFFSAIGVELVLEPTGKYFPTTHSGKTVLEALLKEAARTGVTLQTEARITGIQKKDGFFVLSAENGPVAQATRVVLCTGGLSLPETGSEGIGFEIARSFGHTITRTAPALTPLTTDETAWQELSGIAVDCELFYYENARKQASAKGALLFTHVGFSGPAALDISRHFAITENPSQSAIVADFLPQISLEKLKKKLDDAKGERFVKNFMAEEFGFASRLAETLTRKAGLGEKSILSRLKIPEKRKLAGVLKECALSVNGVVGYRKAEATAGGVDLKEVRVQTMESRLVPGLYFAGEILDVDGRIGGFNFQWAWSSGTIAGRAAAGSLG